MSIDQKRAEILRLIARVNGRDAPVPGRRPMALVPTGRLALDPSKSTHPERQEITERADRVAARYKELAELRKRRLSTDFRDAQVLERVQRLEQRLEEMESLLRQPGALRPPSPSSPPDPLATIDWTLGGVLQEGLLADMLQLVSSNMMTGVFTVLSDALRIDLFFNEGELFHASADDLSGESAFFAAMAVESGRYCFRETTELPQERTISNKTQFLILEALRQIDEARAGG